MQTKRKYQFQTIYTSLFQESVPNAKAFTKSLNVLLFAQLIVVCRTMITWKVKNFCWNVKLFYTTNNTKASVCPKLFLFLKKKNEKNRLHFKFDRCDDFLCSKKRNS